MKRSGYDAESRLRSVLSCWRFKDEEFEFVRARSEYLWIVEVQLVWTGDWWLQTFGARLMFI